jgi:hypothetical protein
MSVKKCIEKRPKRSRIALKQPEDGRRLIRLCLAEIFNQDTQLAANAGKIANLLNTWSKLFELEKAVDLENRIAAIEKAQKEDRYRMEARNDQR